ncbi:gp637 [Bacillus phage G]|uniref:Gp637 n=1 Tax=Bacillus phage G TaxID=2884420 RepID=G3MB17_9CAUD|nr:gp637 [Bacillus phage G]AEO93881.1 gp637 [Bacillus phage G]
MKTKLIKISTSQWEVHNKENGKIANIEQVFHNHGSSYQVEIDGELEAKNLTNFHQAKRKAVQLIK